MIFFFRLRLCSSFAKPWCLSHRRRLNFSPQTADAVIAGNNLMNLFFPSRQKLRIAGNAPLFVFLLKKV